MCTRTRAGRGLRGLFPLLLAGVLLLPSSRSSADGSRLVLLELKFYGNEAVSSGDLRDAVSLRRGDLLTDSSVARAVADVTGAYRERSRYGAVVVAASEGYSDDSSSADLLFTIREGNPAAIGRIEFRGLRYLPAGQAREAFGNSEGDPLDPARLEEGLAALLAECERSGFPFAEASIGGISDGGDGAMTVIVDVAEGDRVTIGEMRVEGNTETKSYVILRESRMDLPVLFDPGTSSRFVGRLRRLGLFSGVEEPSIYAAPTGHGLLVRVREGRMNTFDGVLGYAPAPQGTTGGSVTGRIAVWMRNLFGTGRKLEAEWSKFGPSSQEIKLAYEEPWAFGLPVNLAGRFSQRQQDTSYVDRRVSAAAEFLASASLSVSAVGEYQEVIPSVTEGSTGAYGIAGSTAATIGLVARYDTRDDRVLPRDGVNFRSEYRTGTRKADGGPDSAARQNIRHLGFDFDVFIALRSAHVLNISLHGREISTPSPGPGDLYRIGGFRTLRGFREDQFNGTALAWGTAEYRLIVEGNSFFYGFFDPGYVDPGADESGFFTYGYGVGMRLETGLGLIGVSFALGEGDPVAETKIHFGLINDF